MGIKDIFPSPYQPIPCNPEALIKDEKVKNKWDAEVYEKNPVILENHDPTKILGSTDEFILDGKKYMLAPGRVEHPDGTKQLIELSIIRK